MGDLKEDRDMLRTTKDRGLRQLSKTSRGEEHGGASGSKGKNVEWKRLKLMRKGTCTSEHLAKKDRCMVACSVAESGDGRW